MTKNIAKQTNCYLLLSSLETEADFKAFINEYDLWDVTETYEGTLNDHYVVELPEFMVRWYGAEYLVFEAKYLNCWSSRYEAYFATEEQVNNLWFVKEVEFELEEVGA